MSKFSYYNLLTITLRVPINLIKKEKRVPVNMTLLWELHPRYLIENVLEHFNGGFVFNRFKWYIINLKVSSSIHHTIIAWNFQRSHDNE